MSTGSAVGTFSGAFRGSGAFSGIRAIAFDFDGVVVDSMPVHWSCWRDALETVLGAQAGRHHDAIRRNLFSGRAGPSMFEGTVIPDEARGALRTRKDALWLERAAAVPLMPHAAEALATLCSRYPLAIATTARRTFVTGILSRENVSAVFSVVVTNADVSRPKPAPEMLLRIAGDLALPASEIAMVGDTAFDRQMADAAGSPFLWFETDPLPRSVHGDDGNPVVTDWPALARIFGETTSPA